MFDDVYRGRRVFITGHTGFKGSWLTTWLLMLGAEVCGCSLGPPTEPSHFEILGLSDQIDHITGDIRDREMLFRRMEEFRPEIVFHLAAQALVRPSFADPLTTFDTNVTGTLNVLEALRRTDSVRAAVLITSDKAYRNLEWPWGYRETDRLGGEDPYSASKGCAELVIYCYLNSFFQNGPSAAGARAGNVIGGGDWALDRIVPDAVRAWSQNQKVQIRSPRATRPWQHVLEPLSGYLCLGAGLWRKDSLAVGESFNFGPDAGVIASVEALLSAMARHWPGAGWEIVGEQDPGRREANLLKLCCDKALAHLDWEATLSFEQTVKLTADWYRTCYLESGADLAALTRGQVEKYVELAAGKGLAWTR